MREREGETCKEKRKRAREWPTTIAGITLSIEIAACARDPRESSFRVGCNLTWRWIIFRTKAFAESMNEPRGPGRGQSGNERQRAASPALRLAVRISKCRKPDITTALSRIIARPLTGTTIPKSTFRYEIESKRNIRAD